MGMKAGSVGGAKQPTVWLCFVAVKSWLLNVDQCVRASKLPRSLVRAPFLVPELHKQSSSWNPVDSAPNTHSCPVSEQNLAVPSHLDSAPSNTSLPSPCSPSRPPNQWNHELTGTILSEPVE